VSNKVTSPKPKLADQQNQTKTCQNTGLKNNRPANNAKQHKHETEPSRGRKKIAENKSKPVYETESSNTLSNKTVSRIPTPLIEQTWESL
jgi:hypothetical protein